MKNKRGFASDNNSRVHPAILKAIASINEGHVIGYGEDPYTKRVITLFKKHFGENIDVYFVATGTAANVLGIKAVTETFNSVLCPESAHLYVDECGAPENFIGCKIIPIRTTDGKLSPDLIKPYLTGIGIEHHVQPKVISISQSTEFGTVYNIKELKALADFAHKNNLLLHMDGARIANAAAYLNASLRAITRNVGIDILSFGGTKNGMMYGEAVIFFNKEMSKNFKYIRKQGMHLLSKMRYISIQFETLLSNNLWLENAKHANKMAQLLANAIKDMPKVKITQKVESNAVFATIPKEAMAPLQREYFFYVWNEQTSEVRWMTSFDTTEEDIDNFVALIKKICK